MREIPFVELAIVELGWERFPLNPERRRDGWGVCSLCHVRQPVGTEMVYPHRGTPEEYCPSCAEAEAEAHRLVLP
jgi:hypothetical protein